MSRFLAMLLGAMVFATVAKADYTFLVPQPPGGGTSVWATIIGRELEKKLGERIIIQHLPGAKDIPGPNKFQKELRFDDKTIMVAHGGNAESFLIDKIEYRYEDWAPIGLMNLNIVVSKRPDQNVENLVKFAAGSGNTPDAMAVTMLVCGPQPDIAAYVACYNQKVRYVPNMSGGERRLAYLRGELNVHRETPSAYRKYFDGKPESAVWFTHGVLNLATGKVDDDVNYPGVLFETVYQKRWGVPPAGDLFDAYGLIRSYRDYLQKSLWVNKGNPNTEKLRKALRDMLADPISVSAIEDDSGRYEWVVGDDVHRGMGVLRSMTREKPLRVLVDWLTVTQRYEAIFKPELVQR